MKPIAINPEVCSVREKIYGFEIPQLFYVGISGALSLFINFRLSDSLGMARGMIASLFAVPFLFIALKDFYGLKGWRLGYFVISSTLCSRPLIFRSENIWKGVKRCF